MPDPVGLYDNAYGNYGADAYRQVRIATYGEDLGQTSWVTTEESHEIPRILEIGAASHVLEIGCGSGGYAIQIAGSMGCKVVGVDVNEAGIRTAARLAQVRNLTDRVSFQYGDCSKNLAFQDGVFDAAFANDVLCHVPGRLAALEEVHRVLKPGGRFLFSDALIVGGAVSHQEIATRSSIGYYLFSPPGYNEKLIREAGFRMIGARDTTENAALIAKRWHEAREERREALVAAEGENTFNGVQQFLGCVHALCSERRLLRFLYLAAKRGD